MMRLDLDAARQRLGEQLFAYVIGRAADMPEGAGDPNEAALARYRLVPRLLGAQCEVSLATDFLGYAAAAPLTVGAFAADRLLASEGLVPVARATAELRVPLMVSEECLTPLSEITAIHRCTHLQLRAAGPVERILGMIDRAAQDGARGIVLTALAPVHPRPGLFPGGVDIGREIAARGLTTIGARYGVGALPALPAWGWPELRQVTAFAQARGLPVILKGVLLAEDAAAAAAAGCAAVMISNLGVRQLYRWAPAVGQLSAARTACGPELPVILDGGVRNAADVVVAAALGASHVSLVRPVVLALAEGGEAGVRDLLGSLIDEVATITSWMGLGRLAEIGRDQVVLA